jgi:hypothetical protein
MAKFAYIENNQILTLEENLPEVWKNVSGFHHSKNDDNFINAYGWHRVVPVAVEYDPNLQYIISYTYVINGNIVEETPVIRDRPVESIETKKQRFMDSVRSRRNGLLVESDWTQAVDLQETKPSEWKLAWKTYRQAMRDFPEVCELLDPIDNIESLQWPEKPAE